MEREFEPHLRNKIKSMQPWILREIITRQEREILIITLKSAGYNLSSGASEDHVNVVFGDGYLSLHRDSDKFIVKNFYGEDKKEVSYKGLISKIRKEIEEKVDSTRKSGIQEI